MSTSATFADTFQPSNTPQSYTTLAEAEAAMRAVSALASSLQFDKITSQTISQIVRLYTAPNVNPTPYTFYLTMSADSSIAESFAGATREESCGNAITRLNAAYPGWITGYSLAMSPFAGFENCGDWAYDEDEVLEVCLLRSHTGDSSICYHTMRQSQETEPTCPAGYTLLFTGFDYTNSGPAYHKQRDPSYIYACTNSTTATITQTCTDGAPQIKPLGVNPQPPSIWTDLTKKPSTQDYAVSAVTQCGRLLPNASVTLNYSAVPFSGGHAHHDDSRRNGIFDLTAVNYTSEQSGNSPLTVNTGASGTSIAKYTAPQASGQTKVTMTCALPDGVTCEAHEESIQVGVKDLTQLPLSTQYDLVGTQPFLFHLENHYGTPTLNQALTKLADAYLTAYPGNKLKYNDMSLPQGGLFDCFESPGCKNAGGIPWNPPHKGHRLGRDVDLSFRSFDGLEPQERQDRWLYAKRLVERSSSLKIGYEHGDHWHLTVK